MTEVLVKLPDDLAKKAGEAGLLTEEAVRRIFEEALRREAGRSLMDMAKRLHAANIPPMTDDEVVALVKEVRAERHTRAQAERADRP